MKESEYGGEDTVRTQGIQPKEADTDLRAGNITRLNYATDPADEGSLPDRTATPVYHKKPVGEAWVWGPRTDG